MSGLARPRPSLAMLLLAAFAAAWPSGSPGTAQAEEIIGKDRIVDRIKPRTRGIRVEGAGEPRGLALPAIQFEFNSARFTARARAQVRELGEALRTRELLPYSFTVSGHTDSVGSREYNRNLSLRRALAVKRYLVDTMEVDRARLIEVGFGEDYPLRGMAPDDGRNRRVEVANLGALASDFVAGTSPGRAPARRALLIGIDDYRNVSRLRGPVSDARNMAAFILENGGFRNDDVRLLLNSDATRKGILGAIENWLIRGTSPGDEVFLYYSGHGFQQPDKDNDEDDRLDETLVPVDASIDDDGLIGGMITDDEVALLLERLAGRRVRVVIDACHSGTSTRSGISDGWRYTKTPRRPDGSPLRVALSRTRGLGGVAADPSFLPANSPALEVWSAVRADQVALVDREAGEGGGSVFTRRLLWGVRDRNADSDGNGVVTVEELHLHVTRTSDEYCRKYAGDCPRGLTPQLQTDRRRPGASAFDFEAARLSRMASLTKDLLVRASPGEPRTRTDGVQVEIDPGPQLEMGSEIDISVRSGRDGYLVVLDADAAGNLVQIFPNEASLRAGVPAHIRAGETVTLPGKNAGFRFRTVPPPGRGLLVAIVSDKNARLNDLAARHKDLSVVPSPESFIAEIQAALRSGAGQEGGAARWSVGSFEYMILPPGKES